MKTDPSEFAATVAADDSDDDMASSSSDAEVDEGADDEVEDDKGSDEVKADDKDGASSSGKQKKKKRPLIERPLTEADREALEARLQTHLERVSELSSTDKKIKRRRINHYKKIGKIKETLAKNSVTELQPLPTKKSTKKLGRPAKDMIRTNRGAADGKSSRSVPRFRAKDEAAVTEAVVLVAGLPYTVGDTELRQMFADYGGITKAMIARMKDDKKLSRGFGFVEFADKAVGARAASAFDGTEMEGRTISARVVPPKKK